MADDINGDKRTDYYTHAEFAKRLSDITDEITTKKPKIKLSPLKVLISLFIITIVLTIVSFWISHRGWFI